MCRYLLSLVLALTQLATAVLPLYRCQCPQGSVFLAVSPLDKCPCCTANAAPVRRSCCQPRRETSHSAIDACQHDSAPGNLCSCHGRHVPVNSQCEGVVTSHRPVHCKATGALWTNDACSAAREKKTDALQQSLLALHDRSAGPQCLAHLATVMLRI